MKKNLLHNNIFRTERLIQLIVNGIEWRMSVKVSQIDIRQLVTVAGSTAVCGRDNYQNISARMSSIV